MRVLANGLLTVFFFCCFLKSDAQLFKRVLPHSLHHLIATNERKTSRYVDGNVLKIWYHNNGNIIKAKGRLLIDNAGVVEIIPYGRKPFAVIDPDSIISISRWNRKGKIGLGIAAGAGIVLGIATAIVVNNQVNFFLDPFSILFAIAFITDTYYLAIAIPVVFISEWLSLRSEKKGYHFYVE